MQIKNQVHVNREGDLPLEQTSKAQGAHFLQAFSAKLSIFVKKVQQTNKLNLGINWAQFRNKQVKFMVRGVRKNGTF